MKHKVEAKRFEKKRKPGDRTGEEQSTAESDRSGTDRSRADRISAERTGAGDTRQVRSITRRMNRYFLFEKLAMAFGFSIWLHIAAVNSFLVGSEYAMLGKVDLSGCRRMFRIGDGKRLLYEVTAKASGEEVLSLAAGPVLRGISIVAAIFFLVFVIRILFASRRDSGQISKILDPLNELALKADELSRLSFSEDKFHILEDAIGGIDPEEAQNREQNLSFGDSDLAGVEAAMNNLLARMRDTYRQQARFVNDASHELRTPIAVIQGYANMLDRWGKKDETILDESIAAIRNESEHMSHLVEQLLFLARGDSGRTTLKREATDLRAMMQEVYEESFMIDEKHPYRFRMLADTPDAPIMMQADPGLLKQAVRILIDNAAKYTGAGDEIILGCGLTKDGEPVIQVQDSGIGMAEADVQHMFERFYRSDEVRNYQGTGLGLSIAKWIVDKHKGHFEILSRTELGTRIQIIFPDKETQHAG